MALAVIIAALLCSAFFSASEIAFVAANRLKVEVKARQRGRVGRHILRFLEEPATFLTTTLVGNNIALVVYSTLMAVYLHGPLEHLLATRLAIPSGALELAILVSQSVIAATIVLFVGEILPKTITRDVADRVVFVLALPLTILQRLLMPLVNVAGKTSQFLVRLVRADAVPFSHFPRRAFELVIEEGKLSGSLELDDDETELLTNVFDMHAKRVKESMTPRTEIVAVGEETTLEQFRRLCIETGYSKVPVYHRNIDSIVGIAFALDLFREPSSLTRMMRPVKFVPESKPAKDLFKEFRETNSSIVIVIDEYGGTAGLITREDLLEELFGDIQDEFDSEDIVMRRIDANTVRASGRAEIDGLNEQYDLQLPTGDYETVAGLVLERLGTIPKPQDEFECDGYRFVVLQSTANRVGAVRITRLSATS